MRVLLTGAGGQLGACVLGELRQSGHKVFAWGHARRENRLGVEIVPVELESADIAALLDELNPETIIHLAALSTAEGVRLDPERGHRVNVRATERIADWCGRRSRGLVFSSTDLVFDGSKPWRKEDEAACPIMAYGRSKALAEEPVRAIARGLVARVSLLYGFSRAGKETYFDRTVAVLRRGEPQTMFLDEFRTPLDLATAAKALVKLAEREVSGTIHVSGSERMSRFELISRAAVSLGLDPNLVRGNRQSEVQLPEPRPADVSLDSSRWREVLADVARPSVEEVMKSCTMWI